MEGVAPAAEAVEASARPQERRNAVTLRAIVLGLLLCVAGAINFPYADNVIRGSTLADDHIAVGAIVLFFAVVFLGNGLARLVERRFRNHPVLAGTALAAGAGAVLYSTGRLLGAWFGQNPTPLGNLLEVLLALAVAIWLMFLVVVATRVVEAAWARGRWLSLSRAEMLTIFAMLLMCTALATEGLVMQLTPTLPAYHYYMTPQNHWQEQFLSRLPGWLMVTDENACRGFFEGMQLVDGYRAPQPDVFGEPLSQGLYETWEVLRQIPWGAWVRPLLGWAAFLVPLYVLMICSMVIIRKQWTDREILVYPLTRLPQEMAQLEPDDGRAAGPLFRNGRMWLGFLLPVIFSSLEGIHQYYMGFPEVKLSWNTKLMSDQVTFFVVPSFVLIGFTYLINTRIALSVWTLGLVGLFVSGWLALRGYKSPENLDGYGSSAKPLMYHLGSGALLTMAVLGLWSARRHLAGVLRKAFAGDPDVDDSQEILSYRAAVILCVVCAAITLGWLVCIGIRLHVALFFWLVAMLLFYGLTRIVAEAGLGAVVAPGIAPVLTGSKLGMGLIDPTSMAGLGAQYTWAADIRTFVMAGAANSLKLTQEIERRKGRLFWALLLAVVVSLVASVITTVYISYKYQGTSLELWYYRQAPAIGVEYAVRMIQEQPGANVQGWVYTIVGVALMTFLMVAQRRFLRWPLHPLGLAVMGTWLVEQLWFSIFVAWLIKTLILKYGGPRLYMRTIPFFLGLILGECVIAGAWLLGDYVTGMVGNMVFTIRGA